MPKIIFHIPFKINTNLSSGTNIRPMKMLQAFESLGYEVDLIMGLGNERKKQISAIKLKLEQGEKYDFLYSETSTLPTLLTEPHHLPTHPFLDFNFFQFCKNKNVRIGLFYRDIFWNFDAYSLKGIKALYAKSMYRYDLKKYKSLVDALFLPSIKMLDYFPVRMKSDVLDLPPGHDNPKLIETKLPNANLELFYVGGLSSHYQMEELFESVNKTDGVNLTVCTRKDEWQKAKNSTYKKFTNSPNIDIVHKQNHELSEHYSNTDIAMLFVNPFEYWDFAIPIKLFEYLGNIKPIIASSGTYAGDFVERHNIGWTIDYSAQSLSKLLNTLKENPNLIHIKKENIEKIHTQHSWQSRALKVVNTLNGDG